MKKPVLLDTYCGAGGCSVGYARAGFKVIGVDKDPQPNYPFQFFRHDAIDFINKYGKDFAVIHASPPCQKFSNSTAVHRSQGANYEDLTQPTRAALIATGKPWIMENIPGAPIRPDLKLSGYHFGLGVIRWRWFELGRLFILQPGHLRPIGNTITGEYISVVGNGGQNRGQARSSEVKNWRGSWRATGAEAMGIDWMTWHEMTQAIPPAYTQFIGEQIITQFSRKNG